MPSMYFAFIAWCALMNRARGSQFFSLTDSTTEARIISMMGIAIAMSFLKLENPLLTAGIVVWTLAALMLWCTPAWDKYWGAAIGTNTPADQAKTSCVPVDWVMSVIWPETPISGVSMRLWGWLAMSLRQSLAAVWVIGLACLAGHPENCWLAIFTPLLGTFYFIFGLVIPLPIPPATTKAILPSELAVGAALGIFPILLLQ